MPVFIILSVSDWGTGFSSWAKKAFRDEKNIIGDIIKKLNPTRLIINNRGYFGKINSPNT